MFRSICRGAGLEAGQWTAWGLRPSFVSLANTNRAVGLFGYPRVGVPRMLAWIADWVTRGGAHLGKPTHFEARDGKF